MIVRQSTLTGAAVGLIAALVIALSSAVSGVAVAHARSRSAHGSAHRISRVIKPFRSIDGVRLGFTIAQVDRRFGRPDHRFRVAHRRLAKYDYQDEDLEVGFGGSPRRVIWVATSRLQDHTPQGVRVDLSTMTQARRAYRHELHCSYRSCTLYDRGRRSRPHMSFHFFALDHRLWLGNVELSVSLRRFRRVTRAPRRTGASRPVRSGSTSLSS